MFFNVLTAWVMCYVRASNSLAGGHGFDSRPGYTKDFKNGSDGCPLRSQDCRVSITIVWCQEKPAVKLFTYPGIEKLLKAAKTHTINFKDGCCRFIVCGKGLLQMVFSLNVTPY